MRGRREQLLCAFALMRFSNFLTLDVIQFDAAIAARSSPETGWLCFMPTQNHVQGAGVSSGTERGEVQGASASRAATPGASDIDQAENMALSCLTRGRPVLTLLLTKRFHPNNLHQCHRSLCQRASRNQTRIGDKIWLQVLLKRENIFGPLLLDPVPGVEEQRTSYAGLALNVMGTSTMRA